MSNLWDLSKLQPNDEIVLPGETMHEIFWAGVAKRGAGTMMREKEMGIWRQWSWNQAGQATREITMGLAAIGFKPGETASILSNTVVEWLLCDMAILSAGGVSNGIYPTDAASQVVYLSNDSSSVVLFAEDDEQLDKALEVWDQMPGMRKIVVFDMEGLDSVNDDRVMSLEQLRSLGRDYDKANPGEFEQRRNIRKPEDLAILVYTSGTTGKPKGAMHSHAGIVYAVRGGNTIIKQDETDERMCFLPLCHIAERLGGEFSAIYSGAILNFVENPETIPENVREIAPTVFTAVPRVWEKFYSSVLIGVSESGGLQKAAYQWSINTGYSIADSVIAGQPVSVMQKVKFHIARVLALNNLRKLIGIHRSKMLITGAAPISPDLVRWYLALGVPMLEVWGQTETCGAASYTPAGKIKPGKIGLACPFNELKIDPATQEIMVRGKNVFMGYLNMPDKTAETVEADGWLHTGDVGEVDSDGFFKITDRMKDIIITAGGKNITPSEFENDLKFSPYITDAVLIGDKRAFLTVLIMIDQENVEKYAQDNDIPFSNYTSLTRAKPVQDLIWAEIEKVNKKFARVEQVKKFRLIETQLTAEDEELTPTMKLKRSFVQKKYAPMIESMYSS
jgi:long-chain acyl-CoA synthetase